MCCEPVASAMVSFVQLRNSQLTCASTVSRVCSSVAAGMPVRICADLLADFRAKFFSHPSEIHGAGGVSSENRPISAGSKTAGTELPLVRLKELNMLGVVEACPKRLIDRGDCAVFAQVIRIAVLTDEALQVRGC